DQANKSIALTPRQFTRHHVSLRIFTVRPTHMHLSHPISNLIGAAFLSLLFADTAPAQSLTPEAIVDDFVKAWNSHDVKAFDWLFTADAVWVPAAEARIVGDTDVIKGFEEI